jgi:alanine dehydrogenase
MALFLREDDIALVLRMPEVITAVEDAFRLQGLGKIVNRPRQRVSAEGTILQVMSAAVPALGVMGLKAYSSNGGSTRFLAMLYSTETGELLTVMEANRLGRLRTGAASAVATKYLATPDAGSVGLIGTGWQARSQIAAVANVRPVALIKCFGRDERRRIAFAQEMIHELGTEVAPVESAQEAVDGADIVITATTSREPVLFGTWLRPGMHVNAIGSNWANRRELDSEAVSRAQRIAVDDLEQAKIESGDLIGAVEDEVMDWAGVVELGAIVAGTTPGRASADEVTLFESQGIALEDVAAMKLAYDRAREMGVGEPFRRDAELKGITD